MTENKQTMINGVDVSKCNNFDNGECINPAETVSACESAPFCLFKQLARKTQECETLSSQLDFEVQKKECLEQECEKLKKSVKHWQMEHKEAKAKGEWTCDMLKKKYELRCNRCKLKAENETYKQMLNNPEVQMALTDIRTGERDLWQKYKPRMEQAEQKLEKIQEYCNKYPQNSIGFKKNILQIIDEVG